MATPQPDDLLLLHLNEAIATIRDKEELFQIIARKLRLIFPFDMMGVSIFDEELLNKRLFFKDYTNINPPEPAPANVSLFTPIIGSPVELLLQDPRIQHIELREYVQHYADFEPFQRLLRIGIRYMTMVPMWLNGRLTGFLILATMRPTTYAAADEQLLEKITSLVAVAVRNTLDFEEVALREQQRTLQLNITNALLSIKQREPLFRAIADELGRVVP
ncbi:MAG: GAF domain-containing protein, partial [Cytophagaceae bacterium]